MFDSVIILQDLVRADTRTVMVVTREVHGVKVGYSAKAAVQSRQSHGLTGFGSP